MILIFPFYRLNGFIDSFLYNTATVELGMVDYREASTPPTSALLSQGNRRDEEVWAEIRDPLANEFHTGRELF